MIMIIKINSSKSKIMINKVNRKFVNNRKVKCCIFCLKTDYKKPT